MDDLDGVLQTILARLKGVRKSGEGWSARCSAHDDRHNSLSIRRVADRILLCCHAGCSLEAICASIPVQVSDLFLKTNGQTGKAHGMPEKQIVNQYDYTDEAGNLLFQTVRYHPKDFRQRRPDGNGGWIWNLEGVRLVLFNLRYVLHRDNKTILVCEGEKDALAAQRKTGLCATTNPMGALKWRPEYSEFLRGKNVIIFPHNDKPGPRGELPKGYLHSQQAATSLYGIAASVKICTLPPQTKDFADWNVPLDEMARYIAGFSAPWTPATVTTEITNPWMRALGMDEFLSGEDEPVDFLHKGMIAKGAITEVFSPRGLGKSLWATYVAVELARKSSRVMLIDRDNSRRTVRERLQGFGATVELTTLKFLSRENAPPLTNDRAWSRFPCLDYDAIILDSLDSSAEGVGEQDSSKPSKAIAPLLDIARHGDGPAVLVLGNCVRTAARSRGSGVVEDRADIVFEVRDATDLRPSGTKPWIEELPEGGADYWAARSSRRTRRDKYRLAFIATKFRIGEEPDPFVLEIDLKTEPWTVRDVTDSVDAEGSAAREQCAKEYAEVISRARASLVVELVRRQEAEEPIMLLKDAVLFLMKCGLKRNAARKLLDDPEGAWELRKIDGVKGHPVGVFLPSRPGEKGNRGRNTTPQKPAKNAGLFDAHFSHPHPERTGEIPPYQPVEHKGVATPHISPAVSNLQGRPGPEDANRPPPKMPASSASAGTFADPYEPDQSRSSSHACLIASYAHGRTICRTAIGDTPTSIFDICRRSTRMMHRVLSHHRQSEQWRE
jgi:hypothetical protein